MSTPARLAALPYLTLVTVILSACVKPAEQTTAPKAQPAPEPFSTAAAAPATSQPSVAGIPAAAIAAAERAKAKVEIAATSTADNGIVFKQAQTLFAEKKYAEALRAVNSIQIELLTPAQEKAVTELRAQITNALSGNK